MRYTPRLEHRAALTPLAWAAPSARARPRAGPVALAPRFVCCRRVVLVWGGEFVWLLWLPLRSVVHHSACKTDFRVFIAIFLASSSRAALLARPDELTESS